MKHATRLAEKLLGRGLRKANEKDVKSRDSPGRAFIANYYRLHQKVYAGTSANPEPALWLAGGKQAAERLIH